jgi:type II secretory pathway pseudopilin PulG
MNQPPVPQKMNRFYAQGFTLVEVIAGILITVTFVGVVMQAFVAATALRVRAQGKSEAASWIQEDIELIRHQASQLPADPTRCEGTTLGEGYGDKLRDQVLGSNSVATAETQTFAKLSTVGSRDYTLTRVMSIRNVAPFDTLMIDYTVMASDGAIAAQLYTEVIPDIVFSCS